MGLPLSKVALELDNDTSIVSKTEKGELVATKEMLPTKANTHEVQATEVEIAFIKAFMMFDIGDLKFLKSGLKDTLNTIKSRK